MKTGSRWQIAAFIVAVVATLSTSEYVHAQACRPDLNGDERVDGADLGILLGAWGFCPPGIESVSPSHGGSQGGTVISITGSGLSSVSAVRIGGVPCTGVTVLSPTLVRATTPPGTVGEASVLVTSPGGSTLAPLPFTYVLQQVTSIVPSSGHYAGGTPITINGQFLSGATAVTVGGVPCANVVSVSSTQITAVTPAGSVGAVDLVVTCAKGTVAVPGGFTFLAGPVVPTWATLIEAVPDPAVVTNPALRSAITATNYAWRVRDMATQIEMLLVPPGTYQMGCIMGSTSFGCYPEELPVHQVTLTNPFYLSRSEVTQAQWQARMGSNPSGFQSSSGEVNASDVPNRPVERVSWSNVQGFLIATGMRLPTEAEWEYACRAGTQTPFYNGSTADSTVFGLAWFGANAGGQTRPIGGKAANALGFRDMLGNVWEWVSDWAGGYSSAAQIDPTGPASGSERLIRGGAWNNESLYVRSSHRYFVAPGGLYDNVGFRVARDP